MRKVEFKGPHGRALSYKVLQKYENMSHNIVSLLSQRNKIFSTQISQELLIHCGHDRCRQELYQMRDMWPSGQAWIWPPRAAVRHCMRARAVHMGGQGMGAFVLRIARTEDVLQG